METYTIINRGGQTLVCIDSRLFTELLRLVIVAKKSIRVNDPEWFHSSELYEDMLSNHQKVMEKAIRCDKGINIIQIGEEDKEVKEWKERGSIDLGKSFDKLKDLTMDNVNEYVNKSWKDFEEREGIE